MKAMITPLNLPKAALKLKKKANVLNVWCVIRRRYLVLTPEEWVRQHVIHFLIQHHKISIGRIASEYTISYNGRSKRCDLVVFDDYGDAWMLVECKAPEVVVSSRTLHQAAQYNFELNTSIIMLTNGLDHIVCQLDHAEKRLIYLDEIPKYPRTT